MHIWELKSKSLKLVEYTHVVPTHAPLGDPLGALDTLRSSDCSYRFDSWLAFSLHFFLCTVVAIAFNSADTAILPPLIHQTKIPLLDPEIAPPPPLPSPPSPLPSPPRLLRRVRLPLFLLYFCHLDLLSSQKMSRKD